MSFEEFAGIIEQATNGLATAEYDEEIFIINTAKAVKYDNYWNGKAIELLSEYFDVDVFAYHSDHNEHVGIWICYKERSE